MRSSPGIATAASSRPSRSKSAIAGFHASQQPGFGSLTQQAYQPLLEPGRHKLVGFAERAQGLMLAAGNPLRLQSLREAAFRRARFVNRALGSGTRLLCDELLARDGLKPEHLNGYEHVESSHTAVAQAIASGNADCGLGIEAAARVRGLDFIPLLREHYYLVCLKDALDLPPVAALRDLLQQEEWQALLARLPGYAPWRSGEVLSLTEQLPWWELPPKNGRRARKAG